MTHLGGNKARPNRRGRIAVGVMVAAGLIGSTVVAVPGVSPVGAEPPAEEQQYPFACTTAREGLGQPVADNTDGEGIPVVSETEPGPGWANALPADVKATVSTGDQARPYPNRGGYPDLGLYKALNLVGGGAISFADIMAPQNRPEWLLGHSRDCELAAPVVEYRYLRTGKDNTATPWVIEGDWVTFDNSSASPPADVAYTSATPFTDADDPRDVFTAPVPMIIRWERGTVNRFLYSIAALAPPGETTTTAPPGTTPDTSRWNDRLVFHFGGGVGIGHTQGRISSGNALYTQELQRGYAVLYSTGTGTSHHYNLLLGGRTAVATKERFVDVYGEPLYTVGVGGSGGGIQQYVYGQNHPDLLQGGVPQYSYPDMVTQTIHIGDCELLEHYFEKTDAANPRWKVVENRIPVMGLNAESYPRNKSGSAAQWSGLYAVYGNFGYTQPVPGANAVPGTSTGSPPLTECRAAWTGLTPSAMNPTFQTISGLDKVEGYDLSEVEFTHWDDAGEAYGYDEEGWARVPWGNVGVQYGLRAVAEGRLTPAEFLRLNALVGSWKDTKDQVPEVLPYSAAMSGENTTAAITRLLLNSSSIAQQVPNGQGGGTRPETQAEIRARIEEARGTFDMWASRNMNLSPDGVTPAPRRAADPIAIANAKASGQVLTGITPGTSDVVDIPFIDWRHYLEEELDMHNAHQSFATRQRLVNARGDHDNQLIWFTDGRPARNWDQTPMALDVLEKWITTMLDDPTLSAGEAREIIDDTVPLATDACFETDGDLITAGPAVWEGAMEAGAPQGPCTAQFPLYSTSRIEAGAPITGDVFSCGDAGDASIERGLVDVEFAVSSGLYGLWRPTPAQVDRLKEIFPDGVCDFSAFHSPGEAPDAPATPFTDVNENGFYGASLRWAVALGITTGKTPTSFQPDGSVNRAQMAAFLWRFAGEPRAMSGMPAFPDVPANAYYDLPVRWLVENDLTTGKGTPPRYKPSDTTTRAQVVAFLWRLAGSPDVAPTSQFTDVPSTAFFAKAVAWALENGITTGRTPTTFAPGELVKRSELVTFLKRAHPELYPAPDPCRSAGPTAEPSGVVTTRC